MKLTHRIPWNLPYGYTEVEYDPAYIERDPQTGEPLPFDYEAAAQAARDMEAAVIGTPRKPPPEYPGDPGPQDDVPARQIENPTRPTGASGTHGGARAGSAEPRVTQAPDGHMQVATDVRVTDEHFACPDCGAEAKPSVEKYQVWEQGPDGRMYRQKWFCGNDSCATKSLWRSKLRPMANAGAR